IIGMFVNTLALRNYPQWEKQFDTPEGNGYLNEVKEHCLNAYDNQDYQFEKLVETLNLKRDQSRNQIFDTFLVLQNFETTSVERRDLTFKLNHFENKISLFDLSLYVGESEEGLQINIKYCTKLFKRETIERMARCFKRIIGKLSQNQNQKIGRIEIISEEEKKQQLIEFNRTEMEYPKEKTILRKFEEQVEKTPDNVAVIGSGKKNTPLALTYGELNEKAGQTAVKLRQKGLTPGKIVAFLTEPTPEMIIAILATWKIGAAYMPVGIDYPTERINYILEDSSAEMVITTTPLAKNIHFEKETLSIATLGEKSKQGGQESREHGETIEIKESTGRNQSEEPLPETAGTKSGPADGIAYIMYTSGTTGKPKGVMVPHYSYVNRLHWMQRKYRFDRDDVILQKTVTTFDASVCEMFRWIQSGGRVCLLEPGGDKDPEIIAVAIQRNRVTTIDFVPLMLSLFLQYLDNRKKQEACVTLKRVFVGGDALTPQIVKQFNEKLNKSCGTQLINVYGPTETTVDVTYFDSTAPGKDREIIPIGKPIGNTRLYLLDRNENLQPLGIIGELCVSGESLAAGYLNRTELTAEKFIANPYDRQQEPPTAQTGSPALNTTHAILYKTGDLAAWQPDGNVAFSGRKDMQVKI
ncbi:MAG: amino acid adenylation domain-containing protein, partial [bacterium]|nr:amino acid adenylation domain-containing protein [bacterium]